MGVSPNMKSGWREPDLLVLLRYSEVASVRVETLINDKVELPEK
jgi:hypothetical protein